MYQNGRVKPTLDVWQRAAVALCEWACGYDFGRSKDDPVYKEVTENRDGPGPEQRKRYSSCGDLAHWMFRRFGIRESWVNRSDDGMFGPWIPGVNVSNLWGGKNPLDIVPNADWQPEPGDVLLVWLNGYDAHVCVALGPPEQGRLRTANFGAGGMSPAAVPGSRIANNKLFWDGKRWFYGSKIVQRCLPLRSAIEHVTVTPDLSGNLSMTGEDMDAIQLGVLP